ncbi:28067_t:CDS:1, partial [Gigaspora margarita]
MAKGKRICNQCGNKFATPHKLCNHFKRKFKCKLLPSTMQVKDQ